MLKTLNPATLLHTTARRGPTTLPRSISIFHLFFVHVPVRPSWGFNVFYKASRRIQNFFGTQQTGNK